MDIFLIITASSSMFVLAAFVIFLCRYFKVK